MESDSPNEKNDPFEKIQPKYLLLQLDVNRDKSEYVETRRRSGGGDLSDGKYQNASSIRIEASDVCVKPQSKSS